MPQIEQLKGTIYTKLKFRNGVGNIIPIVDSNDKIYGIYCARGTTVQAFLEHDQSPRKNLTAVVTYKFSESAETVTVDLSFVDLINKVYEFIASSDSVGIMIEVYETEHQDQEPLEAYDILVFPHP